MIIERANNLKEKFNEYIKKKKIGRKNEKQKKTLSNINMLFTGRNEAVKFMENYN